MLRNSDPILKPKVLESGDRIALVAPARPSSMAAMERTAVQLQERGYQVARGNHVTDVHGHFAGSDEDRAADLHDAFVDPQIRAILCVRGGYGSGRLLDLLDYKLVAANPKIFVGFSDITALQLALFAKTGLVSFSGALADLDIRMGRSSGETQKSLWRALESAVPLGNVPQAPRNLSVWRSGRCHGRLLVGCLSLFCTLLGTAYQPCFEKTILLLEDIGEDPYRLDRMFNHLRLAGVFEKISGLILGRFRGSFPSNQTNAISLEKIVDDHLSGIEIPVIANYPYGHYKSRVVLPLGIAALLDTSMPSLTFTESAFAER